MRRDSASSGPAGVPARFTATILCLTLVAVPASPVTAGGAHRAGSRCVGAIQHPMEVHVRPLDRIRRGADVRLEVRASTQAAVGGAEVLLVSPGGVAVVGPRRHVLGRLAPGREATGTFRITVPDQGARFLVQFVVRGEGPAGPLTRGAVYNLLPDGPTDPGREVTAGDGTRVREHAASRSER